MQSGKYCKITKRLFPVECGKRTVRYWHTMTWYVVQAILPEIRQTCFLPKADKCEEYALSACLKSMTKKFISNYEQRNQCF